MLSLPAVCARGGLTTVGVVKRKLQVKCIPNHVYKILRFTNVNNTAIYRVR